MWINILFFLKMWVLPVIDILAVAGILYQAYKIIHGTGATLAFNGLVTILGIYFLSIVLNLHTLTLVVKIFFTYGVVSFIVVFQPEIRHALMSVGENNFFFFDQKNEITVITKILNAIKVMSRKKIGALIVIKQKAGMKNFESTGVKLDAFVTQELLLAIFNKTSPIHDGAVIIDNNRITYAGCFLQLSEKKISKDLGTRHRAALGLSEESDAIILIISEETGMTSLAYKGELMVKLDDIQLKNTLNKLIIERS